MNEPITPPAELNGGFTWRCNLHFPLVNLLLLRQQGNKSRRVVSAGDAAAQSEHVLLATLLQQGRKQARAA